MGQHQLLQLQLLLHQQNHLRKHLRLLLVAVNTMKIGGNVTGLKVALTGRGKERKYANLVYLRKSVLVLLRNASVRIRDASGTRMTKHVKQGGPESWYKIILL